MVSCADRGTQTGSEREWINGELSQVRERLKGMKSRASGYNDEVHRYERMLWECGPAALQGPVFLIGDRLRQGFRSWLQELKDELKDVREGLRVGGLVGAEKEAEKEGDRGAAGEGGGSAAGEGENGWQQLEVEIERLSLVAQRMLRRGVDRAEQCWEAEKSCLADCRVRLDWAEQVCGELVGGVVAKGRQCEELREEVEARVREEVETRTEDADHGGNAEQLVREAQG